MTALAKAVLSAAWILVCLAGWIILGLTVLNTPYWWTIGFMVTGAVIATPMVIYASNEVKR
ncbi:hypothetical protein [Glutamicibacter ardleyensis]|uniref:DUF2530 domain-containing protein n=1 Tax=Glutamicibacter ardleyensis TaxID=225894 RepID=A0ABQ2DFB7_9MICC|nr:hypothetical protein [Glutamicibacter ardleyensis]GGJ56000.1 hypothetical protein GCM10007173_13530 [Glutamicibacter ardleyensis]